MARSDEIDGNTTLIERAIDDQLFYIDYRAWASKPSLVPARFERAIRSFDGNRSVETVCKLHNLSVLEIEPLVRQLRQEGILVEVAPEQRFVERKDSPKDSKNHSKTPKSPTQAPQAPQTTQASQTPQNKTASRPVLPAITTLNKSATENDVKEEKSPEKPNQTETAATRGQKATSNQNYAWMFVILVMLAAGSALGTYWYVNRNTASLFFQNQNPTHNTEQNAEQNAAQTDKNPNTKLNTNTEILSSDENWQKALALFKEQRFDESIAVLKKLVERIESGSFFIDAGSKAIAYTALAQSYYEVNILDAAKFYADKAKNLDDTDGQNWILLGNIAYRRSDVENARYAYEMAARCQLSPSTKLLLQQIMQQVSQSTGTKNP